MGLLASFWRLLPIAYVFLERPAREHRVLVNGVPAF
jgi:hypothetical protein